MSTLDQLRSGVSRAWESVSEGWRELIVHTGSALTRFNLARSPADVETPEHRVALNGARWSILPAGIRLEDDAVEVSLEVPGMERDDFDLRVIEDVLLVRGEKRVERESTRGRYYIMERAYGSFERAIELPVPVSDSGVSAEYKRGVLRVTLPRRAGAKVRRIEVKGG